MDEDMKRSMEQNTESNSSSRVSIGDEDLSRDGVSQALQVLFLGQCALTLIALLAMAIADYYGHGPGAGPFLTIWLFAFSFQIGWTQLLYMPVLVLLKHRRNQPNQRNGVLLVSGILFLATSLCNGMLMLS